VFCGGSNKNINMMLRMIQASFNILISRKNIRKQHHVWWIKNFGLLQKYVPILAYIWLSRHLTIEWGETSKNPWNFTPVSLQNFILFIEVPVPSQESQQSCICVLGVHFIKVPVPSQESQQLCICVLGV
jgi:hypothetical protein